MYKRFFLYLNLLKIRIKRFSHDGFRSTLVQESNKSAQLILIRGYRKPYRVGNSIKINIMKKSLKSLKLKKETISVLSSSHIRGGSNLTGTGALTLGCNSNGCQTQICGNSVPIHQGGIGCVAK